VTVVKELQNAPLKQAAAQPFAPHEEAKCVGLDVTSQQHCFENRK
jgi:hypothetical protein